MYQVAGFRSQYAVCRRQATAIAYCPLPTGQRLPLTLTGFGLSSCHLVIVSSCQASPTWYIALRYHVAIQQLPALAAFQLTMRRDRVVLPHYIAAYEGSVEHSISSSPAQLATTRSAARIDAGPHTATSPDR